MAESSGVSHFRCVYVYVCTSACVWVCIKKHTTGPGLKKEIPFTGKGVSSRAEVLCILYRN